MIIRFQQRGLDVISQRGRYAGDGAGDPAEPGHRGDRQQHAGDLVFGRARRQRPGGAPFQADRRCDPIATSAPTRTSAAVLGSRHRETGRPSPSPAWSSAKPSSMIASLRKISWNLTVWPIPLLAAGTQNASWTGASSIALSWGADGERGIARRWVSAERLALSWL